MQPFSTSGPVMGPAMPANASVQAADEAALQELAGRTEDHAEGVAAFLEKRPPTWTGR